MSLSVNLFRLESSILMRAKRATNQNNSYRKTKLQFFFLFFFGSTLPKTSQGSSRHQTQMQAIPVLSSLYLIFSYFLFIFYFPRCALPDFPSVSSLTSLPFSPCCHRRTTTTTVESECELHFFSSYSKINHNYSSF